MSWQARKYRDYASECVRLAQQADSIEKRNKLLELARVWADAAVVEDQLAAEGSTSTFTHRWASQFSTRYSGFLLECPGSDPDPNIRVQIQRGNGANGRW